MDSNEYKRTSSIDVVTTSDGTKFCSKLWYINLSVSVVGSGKDRVKRRTVSLLTGFIFQIEGLDIVLIHSHTSIIK